MHPSRADRACDNVMQENFRLAEPTGCVYSCSGTVGLPERPSGEQQTVAGKPDNRMCRSLDTVSGDSHPTDSCKDNAVIGTRIFPLRQSEAPSHADNERLRGLDIGK